MTPDSSGRITIEGTTVSAWTGLGGLAIAPDASSSGSVTFNQAIAMKSNFVMPLNAPISVTAYIDVSSGTPATTSDIAATLTYDTGNIASFTNPTSVTQVGSSSVYEVTWQGVITGSNDITVPTGEAVSLEIANAQSGLDFVVNYDSSTYPSKIELPTTTVIDVASLGVYDTANGGGNLIDSSFNGDTVYVRAEVTDPFGDTDITGLNLVIDVPGGSPIVASLDDTNVIDTAGDGTKIYEYEWNTGAIEGGYDISVVANEGLEVGDFEITDTAGTTFNLSALDLGTPSVTEFVDSSGTPIDTYDAGDDIYLEVTDTDKAGTGTITATITTSTGDTETITLTETGASTGVFLSSALSSTGDNTSNGQLNAPAGTVLSASYTDVANPDDTSSDNASVINPSAPPNNPPTAQDDSYSVNANTTLSDNVLTNTNPNAADSDPDLDSLTVVAINGSSTNIGNQITLPSGALLTLNSNGTYTYDPNGQFSNLGLGQSGTDTFEYTISDGNGGIDTAVVTITIDGVNTAPTANNDSFTTSQGTAINLTASALTGNDTDPNGDALSIDAGTFVGETTSNNGTVGLTDGVLTYTPDPGFLGTDTFTYTINDGNGGTATATVEITVSPFTSSATAGAIEGAVYQDDGNGNISSGDLSLAGVRVDLYADTTGDGLPDGAIWATTYTDAEGKYSFTGLVAGDYVVQQTVPSGATAVTDVDGTTSNSNIQVAATVVAGETTTERDFLVDSPNLASISGTVYDDTSGNSAIDPASDTGVAGVALLLYTDPDGNGDPSDGNIIDSTLTDINGDYTFTNLTDGNYIVVEVDSPGATSITDVEADTTDPEYNQIPVTLSGGVDVGDRDFLNENTSLASISGQVIDDVNANGVNDTETGIDNVTIQLFSDPNGDGDPSD
ncbi:beta strand repeat-containing protein, partial [Hyella patelloides]|uniref:beta strand repeat-containing protein n=1 Tax=Hyella patelloides TaxID=1982969 RepID=UPI0011A68FE8